MLLFSSKACSCFLLPVLDLQMMVSLKDKCTAFVRLTVDILQVFICDVAVLVFFFTKLNIFSVSMRF